MYNADTHRLELKVDRQSDPVSFWLRVLDGCGVVILLVIFLMLLHVSK
jgi:hypothetical protein